MIRIERGMPPKILIDPNGAAAAERVKVETFYKQPLVEKAFKFKVYSEDDVKQALERAFVKKCAYCESRYAGTQPMDVEHWRPKAKVLEDDGTQVRGYYWLASEWDNLLPSCIDCNRERHQRLVDLGTTRKVGKAARFPLMPGSPRAMNPGEEKNELTLLLNPCIDTPEEHLEFTDEAVIRPHSGVADPAKAKVSIEFYALNRSGLVEERRQVLLLMQQRMKTITALTQIIDRDDLPENIGSLIEDLLTHEMAELRKFREATRPYALMARQFIDKFVTSLRKKGEPDGQ